MPKDNYLKASIPDRETVAKEILSGREDRILALETRLEELNQLLIKEQRDTQDYRDNVDEENLSESLLNIIKNLQDRVTALEERESP